VEERLSYLETRVGEHSADLREGREAVRHWGQKVDLRFDALEGKMERRFEAIDRRFEAIDRRFEALEGKVDRLGDELRRELASQFRWVVGLQITTLIAVLGAFLAR
jgi:tetrahydromethanopterin S-methyltransferase subunit G